MSTWRMRIVEEPMIASDHVGVWGHDKARKHCIAALPLCAHSKALRKGDVIVVDKIVARLDRLVSVNGRPVDKTAPDEPTPTQNELF